MLCGHSCSKYNDITVVCLHTTVVRMTLRMVYIHNGYNGQPYGTYRILKCATFVAYRENMAMTVLSTIFALVKSVAVHSTKTLRVSKDILECAPFMMGGKESTVLLES